jgi:hypothetical protein
MVEDPVREWFDAHGLRLDAWRTVERDADDAAGNRYTPFTDTPVVQPDAGLAARVHEIAHSCVAWRAAGPPAEEFYDRMTALEEGNRWLAATAAEYDITEFADDGSVLTETEALSAAFAQQHAAWLEDLFTARADGTYTAPEMHAQIGERLSAVEDDLRDQNAPIYDRYDRLSSIVDEPESEAVPMFASMYVSGLVADAAEHREAFYDQIRESPEYRAGAIIPYLQAMQEDYTVLESDIGKQTAVHQVLTGTTDATADLPYVMTGAGEGGR